MQGSYLLKPRFLFCLASIFLTGCASYTQARYHYPTGWVDYSHYDASTYANRLPPTMAVGEKVIVVDPRNHAWGAYGEDGTLVKAGIATAGGDTCEDEPGNCRTKVGTFRIYSLGDESCYSKKYPRPNGGGLMPYCMFFKGGQSLHGSPDSIVLENNVSHGCVRMRIPDAEWLRYNFARVGTKVMIMPYGSSESVPGEG